MSEKRSYAFCDYCSYKCVVEDTSGFIEIKTSPIPGGYPEFNPESKVVEPKPYTQQPKKIKCPKCGRGVRMKKLPDAYSKAYKQIDDQEKKQAQEKDREQRIRDGQPIKREKDTFLG